MTEKPLYIKPGVSGLVTIAQLSLFWQRDNTFTWWLLSLWRKNQCEGKTVRCFLKGAKNWCLCWFFLQTMKKAWPTSSPIQDPKPLAPQLVGFGEGNILEPQFLVYKMEGVVLILLGLFWKINYKYNKALSSQPDRQRCLLKILCLPYPLCETSDSQHGLHFKIIWEDFFFQVLYPTWN